MADSIYHLYIDTPKIKRLFAQGVKSRDPDEKDRFRKLLHRELSGLYQRIVRYNFRQLQFHEYNNRSYLRFHRPEKYGDDLTDFRYSVAYVNREKRYISGFEEGRIFNGYRFVYPLSLDDEHIGSVEVSISMNTVIRQLRERFSKETQVVILRSQVMKKVFPNEQTNYVAWCVDDTYLLDRAIVSECVLKDRITENDAVRIRDALTANGEGGTPFCVEIKVDSSPCVLTFLPIRNFVGENVAYIFEISGGNKLRDLDTSFYVVFAALIALLILLVIFMIYYRISQHKIERMATFDALTGVFARGVLMEMLDAEYERYKRYHTPFSLVMLDIDHFKQVNDTYGHHTGDVVLAGVTSIMKRSIRKSDILGRYGGEEFIVVLPETRKTGAVTVAEKLRQQISSHDFDRAGTVTVSCGVVEMFEGAQSVEEVVNEADQRLYTAKREGRNRVVA